MTRELTNNEVFALRWRADKLGNDALVDRIDRWLRQRGKDDLDVILGILEGERQAAAPRRAEAD